MRYSPRLLILILTVLLVAPVLANPGGPPWENSNGLIVENGCSCHGDGAPSTAVVVSISGVPRSYEISNTYTFTDGPMHQFSSNQQKRHLAPLTKNCCEQ